MKTVFVLVIFQIWAYHAVYGAENEVLRVFDDKLRLTERQMEEYLKKANLEAYGFTRTVEVSTETDEYGKTTKKRTIYYKVTDDCSKAMFWESVLDQRLPAELKNTKIISTMVKEVKSRLSGRDTKRCTIGFEIHPNRCMNDIAKNSSGKRRLAKRGCSWCAFCWSAAIQYK